MIAKNELPEVTRNRGLIPVRIFSRFVALALVAVGGAKLAAAAVRVELFDKFGLGQWFRHFRGIREVSAGVGLLISRYSLNAAVRLAVVMASAMIAQVRVLGISPEARVVWFALSGIIAYLSKPQNINQQRSRT
jgi:hypothetical protein